MSLTKGHRTYIMPPHHILNYDSRKSDGSPAFVKVGNFTSIGQNCTFVMSNHVMDCVSTFPIGLIRSDRNLFEHKQGNPSSYVRGDIEIGHDVWIGANVTIMDNVKIANGSVVAAGSVVTRDVPPYAIVGGNPASVIKYRFKNDIIKRLEDTKFWELPEEDILRFDIWSKDIEGFITAVEAFQSARR